MTKRGVRTDLYVAQYKKNETQENLDRVIMAIEPLVRNIASKFGKPQHIVEDLMQEGSLGVMDALRAFNVDAGVTFSTYAHKFIHGRMQHYLRDFRHQIRYPAWIQEFHSRRIRMQAQFRREHKREAHEYEIAKMMKLDWEQYESNVQTLIDAGKIVASYDNITEEESDNTGRNVWYNKSLWSGVAGESWEKPSFLMVLFNEALSMRNMGATQKELASHFQLTKAKAKKLVEKLDEYRAKQNEMVPV